jgi:signal transduction histidine kinase
MKTALLPSLQGRLIVNQLMVIVGFAAIAIGNLLWHVHYADGGELDTYLEIQAQSLLGVLERTPRQPEPLAHDKQPLARQMQILAAHTRQVTEKVKTSNSSAVSPSDAPFDMAFRLLDASDQVIYVSPGHAGLAWPSRKPGGTTVQHAGVDWRAYSSTSTSGELTVQVAEISSALNDDVSSSIFRYVVMPLLAFLPVAALMTGLATRRGLAPLRELAQVIAGRTPHTLQPLGPIKTYCETQPLVTEINSLLHKLQSTLSRERDFMADAAHEMRTPLAVIQAQVHVLQTARSQAERDAAAQELTLGVERAASLIGKLLLTARVSSDEFQPRMELVDLTAFTQERIALLSTLAAQKDIEMELRAPARAPVRIDRETFVSAVDNVIDNAIRYTPVQGRIVIEIDQPTPAQVRLRVVDNGLGIPPHLHERVLERFFRVHSGEQQGSGLGLAIVKRVLALHGGQVALSQGMERRGLTVTLTVPQGV